MALVYTTQVPVDESPDATEGYLRNILVRPIPGDGNRYRLHSEFLMRPYPLGLIPCTDAAVTVSPPGPSVLLPFLEYSLELKSSSSILSPLSTLHVLFPETIPPDDREAFVPAVFGDEDALKTVRVCAFLYLMWHFFPSDFFWPAAHRWMVSGDGDFTKFEPQPPQAIIPLLVFLQSKSTAIEAKFIQYLPQLCRHTGDDLEATVRGISHDAPLYPYLQTGVYRYYRVLEHNAMQVLDALIQTNLLEKIPLGLPNNKQNLSAFYKVNPSFRWLSYANSVPGITSETQAIAHFLQQGHVRTRRHRMR